MDKKYIKNLNSIGRSKGRLDVLSIINAGLNAVDTKNSIQGKISLDGNILHAGDTSFNLNEFSKIIVYAFGKASVDSVIALEEILGDRITSGIAIDKRSYKGKKINVFEGSHPYPSIFNIDISTKIKEEAKLLTEKDLVIVVVSGGGSALFCYPESECEQGIILYDAYLKSGGSIRDLNIIRKHVSSIKGGGLAKILYPATVVSLILCDVSGEHYEEVASGPTYKDITTVKDAEKILAKYNIEGGFVLNETPKEDIYFEKVFNIPIISNVNALEAMKKRGEDLGYFVSVAGSELYNDTETVIKSMVNLLDNKTVVIGGGEPSLKIISNNGEGGRNEYAALCAINLIDEDSIFSAVASDGIDNHSKYAGAIIDKETKNIIRDRNINLDEALKNFDPENLFFQTNDLIEIGDTGSNVSDLFLLLKE